MPFPMSPHVFLRLSLLLPSLVLVYIVVFRVELWTVVDEALIDYDDSAPPPACDAEKCFLIEVPFSVMLLAGFFAYDFVLVFVYLVYQITVTSNMITKEAQEHRDTMEYAVVRLEAIIAAHNIPHFNPLGERATLKQKIVSMANAIGGYLQAMRIVATAGYPVTGLPGLFGDGINDAALHGIAAPAAGYPAPAVPGPLGPPANAAIPHTAVAGATPGATVLLAANGAALPGDQSSCIPRSRRRR